MLHKKNKLLFLIKAPVVKVRVWALILLSRGLQFRGDPGIPNCIGLRGGRGVGVRDQSGENKLLPSQGQCN